jgi:hypothetical protein
VSKPEDNTRLVAALSEQTVGSSFKIYPNPNSTKQMTVSLQAAVHGGNLEIYNFAGQLQMKKQ